MLVLAAALLLAVERVVYIVVWRRPASFRRFVESRFPAGLREPVDALRALFFVFKGIQVSVFGAWVWAYGLAWPPEGPALAAGLALGITGQVLNAAVFRRLGRVGVFYGARFGHHVPWSRQFPFSMLDHPQYVGTVMSIWGFFLVTRYPHGDWWVLPVIESAYYVAGMALESD